MASTFTFHDLVRLEDLAHVRRFVEKAVGQCGTPDETAAELVMAINEAVTNVIIHGYAGRPGVIEIEVRHSEKQLVICLRDQAPLFDPTINPEPDVTAPLEARGSGGMGVHMMRHFTDDLQYQVTADGYNQLSLIKMEAQHRNQP